MIEAIITQLKKSIESNTDIFCSQFCASYESLALTVDPVGAVTLPVTAKMAKSLIVEAEPARYGHKEKTLLDRSVRDTWEIPSNRIQTGIAWNAQLQKALKTIQNDLNLPEDGILTADLHNLLIYMPGQFFKAHQDSEKADGMLATLVVVLPSEFTGGEMIIDQHGDKRIYDFSADSPKNLTFVAFYSDCYHEVKEVTSGYRLALTYNLSFHSNSKTLKARRNFELERAVQNYFYQDSERTRENDSPRPQWLVYLLDHQYTRSSLDWHNLRGADRERVGELLACADHLGLSAHLSLADVHETWSTEGDDDHWGGRYQRRWRDDEGEDDNRSTEYVLSELIEDEIILRHWIDRSAKKYEQWDKYVPRQMVCWTKAVDQFKPFKSNYEGYQGNYGNTLDRWYHRAAIILWKKEFDLISVFSCDKEEALGMISETLKKDLSEGHRSIHQILPYWPQHMHRFLDSLVVLEFANLVQHRELASTLIKTLGISSIREKNLPSLMSLMESYGEDWLIQIFNLWRKNREWDNRDSILDELSPLVTTLSSKYKRVSGWILEDQFSLLIRDDSGAEKCLSAKRIRERLPQKLTVIKKLLRACQAVGESGIRDKIVDHVLRQKLLYPEVELVHLFIELDKIRYAAELGKLRQRLEKQISAPRNDGDWSIRDVVPDDCSDCEYLKNFLLSHSTQKLIWPLAKDRRAHIHEIIDSMDIPVTHKTLYKGSPHKLVLTKTPELFVRDRERNKAIETCLTKLRNTEED